KNSSTDSWRKGDKPRRQDADNHLVCRETCPSRIAAISSRFDTDRSMSDDPRLHASPANPESNPEINAPAVSPHTAAQDDRQFLEGPRTRTAEFLRVLRIAGEFIRG